MSLAPVTQAWPFLLSLSSVHLYTLPFLVLPYSLPEVSQSCLMYRHMNFISLHLAVSSFKHVKSPSKKQFSQLLTWTDLVLCENGHSTWMLRAAGSKVLQCNNKAYLSVLCRTQKINTRSVLDKGKQIFLFLLLFVILMCHILKVILLKIKTETNLKRL